MPKTLEQICDELREQLGYLDERLIAAEESGNSYEADYLRERIALGKTELAIISFGSTRKVQP